MKTYKLFPKTGEFAENKDLAKQIRTREIMPLLESKGEITLDFEGVESATQSFIHALLSEPIRSSGGEILEDIYFRNCNENIKKIINIVIDYMQIEE